MARAIRARSAPWLIALLLSLGASPALAQLPAPVAQALRAAQIPEDAVGFSARDVATEQPLAAFGADRPMNPASVIKLVTTFAALDILGPAYGWTTEAYAAGPVRDGVLEGDLVLKGNGAPKHTLEDFWMLLRAVRARGVREVRGDLVLDRSAFALAPVDPAAFDNEPTRPHNTPPDALLINFKTVRLVFQPDLERRRVQISVEPPLPQVEVVNNLQLDNTACPDWLARMKIDAQGDAASARLAFSGAFSAQCGERVRHFSLLAPTNYVAALFRQMWGELGGRPPPNVREDRLGAQALLLAAQPTPSVSEIVRDVNKFSNNVMARQLYLALGVAQFGAPATLEKSHRAMRQWLAQRGIAPETVMENGSGLSRVERISAKGITDLLVAAFRSPVMPELMASMPVVGVDGTLRRRGKGAEFSGQAHIKGGTIANVRAIGGYVLDQRGRRIAVAMLVNHPRAPHALPVFDVALQWAYARGAGGS